ncbi:hypothetical protein EVG20_g9938 [Dentipellis fragilis]|uniref:Dienelactone hydrolase domain-containing protein n=1 Tax=Dentipellis fragilis TaxID=205917 RepID=A0A4Y9XUN7_9AGAM|nr:hypothetical protein EVG20_g9938 [Dentipellis fragilis]
MDSDRVLAAPPGKCCTKAVQHSGTPRGVWESIGTMNAYVSHPPERKQQYERIMLFFPDVFGPTYINNQLLMDYFASHGYLVLGPDYFEGDPVHHHVGLEPGFDVKKWYEPKRERANDLVPPWIEAVKELYGTEKTKYVAVGYCFGAPDLFNCAASEWLVSAAVAHPALLTEGHFRRVKRWSGPASGRV